MAKLVYGLNQSLDGYIDHQKFRPSQALFRHFNEQDASVMNPLLPHSDPCHPCKSVVALPRLGARTLKAWAFTAQTYCTRQRLRC